MQDGLLGVEPRHLATLSAIADTRSFKAAAERRGYAPSAVRHQLAQFERLVGAPLLARRRGLTEVELTDAGAALVPHARAVTVQMEAAMADLRALANERLRVGVPDRASARLLLAALPRLLRQTPAVAVQVCDDPATDLREAVLGGAVDVAFSDLPVARSASFASHAIVDDKVVLIARPGRLPAHRPLTVEDLAALPLLVARGTFTAQLLDAVVDASGLTPAHGPHVSPHADLQALAAAGVGVAVVPALAVDPDGPRVAITELPGLLPRRPVSVFWHAGRLHLPGLEAFIAAAVAAGIALGRERRFRRLATVAPIIATGTAA